ncbi:Fe-S cluster assembly ATPase SufC [Leptolyngbya sp. FACHB-261]|uniref:Fe-S cluster assembly ATPase SufC n=1 Tax=Leptolyngbya sp. FACHB-261 TaxID=2692806 RepID=UPI00168464C4|nr:Fe-S cluster assembly ATPase SufC [Leptolyngbya sp. FACHB-261]MBD2101855.1 Fe-S cluster assembly ATPase SufC [Leptolyngbya sp. FACHB-261]
MSKALRISNLKATVEGASILKGVDLEVRPGEICALMGPNGSGKSTLAYTLMGHPKYQVTSGEVFLGEDNLLEMDPSERSRAGLFLAFQYPHEIPGVTITNFLRTTLKARGRDMDIFDFQDLMEEKMAQLEMDRSFAQRYLNDGFSGGEKKRAEALQMLMLEPSIAILDETDSGLDVDALRIVSQGVNSLRSPDFGALVITHYQRILDYITPDRVVVFIDGRVVLEGGPELAKRIEREGYDSIRAGVSVEA